MNSMYKFAAAAALALGAGSAHASNFSFTGGFLFDNDVQFIDISVAGTSNVVLKTFSYAGGTMGDGTFIGAGGFDPVVAIFDALSGALIDWSDDSSAPDVGTDPGNGFSYDAMLEVSLGAGDYVAALMQQPNSALGDLSDGFEYDGPGFQNFTETELFFNCSNGVFCDENDTNRTGNWAIDVQNVASAALSGATPVPLPASLSLGILALGGVCALRRRR